MNFEVRPTMERRYSLPKMEVSVERLPDPPKQMGEELFQEGYVLQGVVSVKFFANPAQMQTKRKQAEKTMRAHLFGDMLPLVEEILLETNQEEVARLAALLKTKMMGE